jgi:hypothetical protein
MADEYTFDDSSYDPVSDSSWASTPNPNPTESEVLSNGDPDYTTVRENVNDPSADDVNPADIDSADRMFSDKEGNLYDANGNQTYAFEKKGNELIELSELK